MPDSHMKLLAILSDGKFHSGVDIGRQLNISRSAVWKQLQKLIDLDLEIDSVKSKGYRLLGGFEPLDTSAILAQSISTCSTPLTLELFDSVESTNTVAMERAVEGKCDELKGYVCLAERQSKGKGRRGRHWSSPYGRNIYLSLIWEFEGGANKLEGLSLAVGMAVAESLNAIGLSAVKLKWPNDILVDGKKLGGILVEMAGDPAGLCQVVIGVGLNVHMQRGDDIEQPWASIGHYLPEVSRNYLTAEIIRRLFTMLAIYEKEGFTALSSAWQQWDGFADADVCVHSGASTILGVAKGIYPNGALRLVVDGVDQAIYGGEVSLRLAQNDS
ncbi:bifunctional biotin--[acetyl-CoA-carboxylase] ligase/biotin operon repressor BirA [Eionea flava]